MNEHAGCDLANAAALATRYVARTMDEGERIAFENHFVACADCQSEIRLAEAVRLGVRASTAPTGAPPRRSSRRTRWSRYGAGIAAAAGIAAVMMFMMSHGARSPALSRLGAVIEPPVYLGVAVRGVPAGADSAFDRAMDAYRVNDFSAATAGLRGVLAAGQDSVPAEFFLGASELMSNDAAAAAASLNRVIARGDTPYLDEAQLYEAKALIRLGRGRDALDVLAKHTPADPLLAAAVTALSDSVARLIAR